MIVQLQNTHSSKDDGTYTLQEVVGAGDDPFVPHTFDVPISSRVLGTSWNLNHSHKHLSAVRDLSNCDSLNGSGIPSQTPAAVYPLKSRHASSPPHCPSYTHHSVRQVIATAGSWTTASSPSHTLPILPRHLNAPALQALPIQCIDRTRISSVQGGCYGEGL